MADRQPVDQDEYQLGLLAIFHYVRAGLAALFVCIPLTRLLMGLLMVFEPGAFDKEGAVVTRFMEVFVIVLPAAMIVLGWTFAALLACVGHSISGRKHSTFCLVMGYKACMFMPFAIALGIYRIIGRRRPSVKAFFAA